MHIILEQNRSNAHYPILKQNGLYLKACGKFIWTPIHNTPIIIHTGWVNKLDREIEIQCALPLLQQSELTYNIIEPNKEFNLDIMFKEDYMLRFYGGDSIIFIPNVKSFEIIS